MFNILHFCVISDFFVIFCNISVAFFCKILKSSHFRRWNCSFAKKFFIFFCLILKKEKRHLNLTLDISFLYYYNIFYYWKRRVRAFYLAFTLLLIFQLYLQQSNYLSFHPNCHLRNLPFDKYSYQSCGL